MATTAGNHRAQQDKPVRVALFATLAETDHVVAKLLAAGFTKEEITVVCSDEHKERHFKEFEHQRPAGARAPYTAAAGGAIGAVLGGLAVLAGASLTGGAVLVFAGGAAAWTGAIAGGLIGAMMSRGYDKEVANFYDQEVQKGLLLVAIEVHGANQATRLVQAERIFAESNAVPIALASG